MSSTSGSGEDGTVADLGAKHGLDTLEYVMRASKRSLLAIAGLILVALPSSLLAQSHAGSRRAQVFLIPNDTESVRTTTQVAGHFERALGKANRIEVVDLAPILSGQPPPEFESALRQARAHLQRGQSAYTQVRFSEAVDSLGKALAILRENIAWIDRMPEYADTLAYLASSYMMSGQTELGEATYKELLLHKPDFGIDDSRFDSSLQQIVDRQRSSIETGPVGSISVSSEPAGARVFVSGNQRGFTPLSIDRIPAGRHVLRLEQLGTMPHGEVIEVTPTEDGTFQIDLRLTDEFQKLQTTVSEVGRELESGRVGPSMIRLGRHVRLDWAVYGIVQRTMGAIELNAWIVSIPHQRRIATRRFQLPTTEFNLEAEIENAVLALVEDAWRRDQRSGSTSPPPGRRTRRDGLSEDGDEVSRTRSSDSPRRRSLFRRDRDEDDPLDERDGTEGW